MDNMTRRIKQGYPESLTTSRGGGKGGAKAILGSSFNSDRDRVTAVAGNLDRTATPSPASGSRCAKSL